MKLLLNVYVFVRWPAAICFLVGIFNLVFIIFSSTFSWLIAMVLCFFLRLGCGLVDQPLVHLGPSFRYGFCMDSYLLDVSFCHSFKRATKDIRF